ncbi:MAG: S26 family signal peptidase [Gammaproteobacteria bacterium]|jgi:conjugal transfer pilin signal peptidase TrbI|nr:S26 family signal peptidase [Gammaproteobacteria bacterium]MBT3725789.1 S26 family signal peptidase [Gammaproteobacteria bacterium]MBT4194893.1 S26 family signal peptidase [Gammaproteobacteria bacterium]MBT4451500.1 S26 family signal peptidase [Gammaproteobacteria bacterium]MBT4862682.1 S26 family signal peptidase [Gammaproteobacteria bacterium]
MISEEVTTALGKPIKPKLKGHQSWSKFWIKSLIVLGVMILSGSLFATRYRIVGDPQEERCIPAYSVYLVDLKDVDLERGNLYMFKSNDLNPIYEKDTNMLKYLRGLPGDTVEIQANEQVLINGKYTEFGLSLAKEKLGTSKDEFVGSAELADNQYWFLGTSPKSFDSRYWGSVTKEQIVGRAYPLF